MKTTTTEPAVALMAAMAKTNERKTGEDSSAKLSGVDAAAETNHTRITVS